MTIQVLRPSLHWLHVQADQPFYVPRTVTDVAGIRYLSPDPGYTLNRCEIPFTAWQLPQVREWLRAFGCDPVMIDLAPWSNGLYLQDGFAGLFDHQREAVEYLVKNPHAILGLEMGLGKTRAAAVASEMLVAQNKHYTGQQRPVLITGPKTLRETWRREIAAAGLEGKFVALEGTKPNAEALEGAQWIFCHYDILHVWWSFIFACKPVVGILDEAHLVKSARTIRGKACALALSSSPYRFALTGTPIENRLREMWHLLDLATGPWTWGSQHTFAERYCGAYTTEHGQKDGVVSNPEELQARLATCYYRRTVAEVGIDLPPHTREVVELDVTDADRETYAELMSEGEKSFGLEEMTAALLQRRASQAALTFIMRLRKLTSKIKLKTSIEIGRSLLLQDEAFVTFTWTRATAATLQKAFDGHNGAPSHLIHGGVTDRARQESIDKFQAWPAGHGASIVATLDSLSVGVTLHRARHAIVHDLDPVPSKILQAIKRIDRIGQVWPTRSYLLFARGTIDEIWARLYQKKAEIIDDALGDTAVQSLSDLIEPQEVYEGVARVLDWATRS